MDVVCPKCESTIHDAADGESLCPACGSTLQVADGETIDWSRSSTRKRLGKFELIREVGAGSFGCVYQARDTELGRTVAVKIPRANSIGSSGDSQRFLREARSVARLRHPSIVPVFEIGQDDGQPFLVSEFIHGVTLDDLMTSEPIGPKAAADLVAKLADALDYAHNQGVVHRDVKPSNIMLEMPEPAAKGSGSGSKSTARRHVPRLMDFGLAKHDDGGMTMTVEGEVLGTPAYMSPEQARGDSRSVDGRTDVYSLGVILYRLLTGELPFKGNARMLLHQVLHDEPKAPRSLRATVPKDLETICLKAMAKDHDRRYDTAAALAADLRRFLDDEPILARPASMRERIARRVRRNGAVTALTAVVVVLLGVVVGVVLTSRRPVPVPVPIATVAPTVVKVVPAPASDPTSDDLLKAVADLDRTDPNWRLEDIEATRPDFAEDENGGMQVVEFAKAVDAFKGKPGNTGDWTENGNRDFVRILTDYPPPIRLSDADANALRDEMKRVEPLLLQARKLRQFPRGRFPVKYTRDSFSTMLPDVQAGRSVGRLLEVDADVQLQDGHREQAVDDGVAMLNLTRYYDTEPFGMAQLVRAAIAGTALRCVERIEAQGEGTDEELREFAETIDAAVEVPSLLTFIRGERGSMHHFFSALESGDIPKPELLEMFGLKDRSELPSAQDTRRIHAWSLRYWSKAVELAKKPPEERFALLAPLVTDLENVPLRETRFVQLLLVNSPYVPDKAGILSGHVNTTARYVANCRSAATALAVERYRLAHKEWPTELSALVPTYLKSVPVDPFDGLPLRYRRTFDGVIVYSIGIDRVDNQGAIYRSGARPEQYDDGFQLWDPTKRGQPSP